MTSIVPRVRNVYLRIHSKISACIRGVKIGSGSIIISPKRIHGNVIIGNNTCLNYKSWIEANALTGERDIILKIGNGCIIGNYNEIYATKCIILEDDVLTADRVYITDNLHGYSNIELPIKSQPIKQISTVVIGEGSWLGVGVCVIGAKIGKHCVIGANSVVTHDIPDYCVAVGSPAKVIKRYNNKTKVWERV